MKQKALHVRKKESKRIPQTNSKNEVPENSQGLHEFKNATGSKHQDLSFQLISQAFNASYTERDVERSNGEKSKVDILLATIQALEGFKPKDELEGMLAAQMVSIHNTGMRLLERAGSANLPAQRADAYIVQSTKLLRTFAALLEALNRHRGKGQQKVIVEHVNVHSGGQAIVGVVERPRGVGNVCEK